MGLSFRAQSVGVNSINISYTGQQPPVQCPLLIELVVKQRLLSVIIFHFLQESREAGNPGGGSVCLVVAVLGAEQVLASCAAAASDVGVTGRGSAVIGVEEGRSGGWRAVIR